MLPVEAGVENANGLALARNATLVQAIDAGQDMRVVRLDDVRVERDLGEEGGDLVGVDGAVGVVDAGFLGLDLRAAGLDGRTTGGLGLDRLRQDGLDQLDARQGRELGRVGPVA